MHEEITERLRARLAQVGAAGMVVTSADNVAYLTGYQSVMDGWHLPEPISAVFLPASPALPLTLFLPEATLIGLVVAAREGQPIHFERLRTFDLLNFCATARAEDQHLALAPDLLEELTGYAAKVDGACAPDIVASLAAGLEELSLTGETVLFDDMRVALSVQRVCGQQVEDGLDTIMSARALKTPPELALFRESGKRADRVMAHTVAQLGVGKSWAEIEKSVAHFMIDQDIDPLPGSPMLFGGSYDALFKPDLFRTHYDTPFQGGEIAILETQGRYRGVWIDINRTAHIGAADPAYREQHAIVQRCFEDVAAQLRPGANSASICEPVRQGLAKELAAPEKLLMIVHSIGRVPLESPVRFPSTGLHAAVEGFEVRPSMVLSFIETA